MPEITTSPGLAMSGLGRLLWHASVALGTESPNKVSANLVGVLKATGPILNTITTLVVPWAMLVAAFYQHKWFCQGCISAKDYLCSFLYASVSIPSDHELHHQVLRWIIHDGFESSRVRTLALTNASTPGRWQWNGMSGRGKPPSNLRGLAAVTLDESGGPPPLSYIPDIGKYPFYFRGQKLVMERRPQQMDNSMVLNQSPDGRRKLETVITISCFSPWLGVQPIRQFLGAVVADIAAGRENMTSIYRPFLDARSWDHGVPRTARTLDAVTLEAGVKEVLVEDMRAYLDPKTKRYYTNRGIPWRRGYLFWGPPGTGKTSFTTALAGHFKLNVYMISLSSQTLNDAKLDTLFDLLPQKCIVLLEDIDSAGIRREDMSAGAKKKEKKKATAKRGPYGLFPDDEEPESVTLSGLLNVLDGVRAAEGRIVIMTTNKPETLDAALIRRGRIDQRVHFGCASRETARKLFTQIFCKSGDELLEGEAARDEQAIAQLAEEFAAYVPEHACTPADVQGYLIDRRTDPVRAVQQAAASFERLVSEGAGAFKVVAGGGEDADVALGGGESVAQEGAAAEASPPDSTSSESVVLVNEDGDEDSESESTNS
ncbi:hypothetical protein LTR53_015988 [Teratosphaeriaceae sp. CCFEE 6253]|nr:hypothetical protein LTR53_015988 [Teratosphaeriaceae sp. CCFEE 6253]